MDYSEELRKYYTIYQKDLLLEKEFNHTKHFFGFIIIYYIIILLCHYYNEDNY